METKRYEASLVCLDVCQAPCVGPICALMIQSVALRHQRDEREHGCLGGREGGRETLLLAVYPVASHKHPWQEPPKMPARFQGQRRGQRVCENGILKRGEQGRKPSRGHRAPKKEGKSEASGQGLRQDQERRGRLDPGQRPGPTCLLIPPNQGPRRAGSSVCPQRWSAPGWRMGQV